MNRCLDSVDPSLEGEPRMSLDEAYAEQAKLEAEFEAAKARRDHSQMSRLREQLEALAREFGL